MYIWNALKNVYKTSRGMLFFALFLGSITAGFLRWQGLQSLSSDAVNILLTTVALYAGTFTAFLGVMYSLIVTPLSYAVKKHTYLKRLKGIRQAMDNITVSIALAVFSVPLGLLSKSSLNPAKCGSVYACHYASSLGLETVLTAITVIVLTVVFALTLTSLGQMHVLSGLAEQERREAIESFFGDSSEFFEPSEKEKDASKV